MDLHLVYTSDVHLNPLSKDLVKTLRISIQGEGMATLEAEFELAASDGAEMSNVSVGNNRVVTVEGYNSAGELVSRGRSLPFRTGKGSKKIYLFFSIVGSFSPPPSGVAEFDWINNYKTRMSTTRVFHDATELPNGLVLVTGGVLSPSGDDVLARVLDEDMSDPALRSLERFDSTAGAFFLEQEQTDCNGGKLCLRSRRSFHCAKVMPGEELVLLTGGEPIDESWPAEYYHVESNSFGTKETITARTRHSCVAVQGGLQGVLVAGGMGMTPNTLLEDIEFIGSGNGMQLPILSTARAGTRAVAYTDGVLIVGGWDQWEPRRASSRVDHLKFTGDGLVSSSWFEMQRPRAQHTAVLLKETGDGAKVLVCGGLYHDIGDELNVEGSCEILDAESDTSQLLEGFELPIWAHTATVLNNGRVLLAGGFSTYGQTMLANNYSMLLDNPLQSSFKRLVSMISKRAGHTATLLPNGMLVLIGGISAVVPTAVEMATQDYEIYNPFPE